MDVKKILTHLIRAGRNSLHLEHILSEIGYTETPYFNLYGEILEAIYGILDEQTDSIDQSIAYTAFHDIYTPDEICADELASHVNIPDISETTMEVISEVAQSRGIPKSTMIRLILNEWAMKEMYSNSVLG